jgi:hypothetical protein
VKKAIEMGIIEEDCGCEKRKAWLNEKVSYGTGKDGEVLQGE